MLFVWAGVIFGDYGVFHWILNSFIFFATPPPVLEEELLLYFSWVLFHLCISDYIGLIMYSLLLWKFPSHIILMNRILKIVHWIILILYKYCFMCFVKNILLPQRCPIMFLPKVFTCISHLIFKSNRNDSSKIWVGVQIHFFSNKYTNYLKALIEK